VQKRHVLVCEGSLCPIKLPDVSGPGLGEAGRYTGAHKWSNRSDLFRIRQSDDRSDRSDRSNWNPSTTRTFCRFSYVIGFLAG